MIFEDHALTDFRNFLYLTWLTLGLPQPTRVQYDMADALQGVLKPILGLQVDPDFKVKFPNLWDESRDRPVRKISLPAFRGVGKSWITSALIDWCLGIRPDLNTLVSSAGKARADAFSTFTKRLLHEIDVLRPLLPDPSKGQRYSNVAFDVGPAPASHAPSVFAMGVFGQITGGRADIFVGDDVEVPNNSETQAMREKLSHRVKELGGAVLKPDGVGIYLGTPQCEETIYAEMEGRGYARVIWPARYPNPQWMKAHGYALAPMLVRDLEENPELAEGGGLDGRSGMPTDPERFDELDLQDRECEYGRSWFALQFMLDTTLADADRYPLKLSDLVVMDLNPDLCPEHPVWASSPDLVINDLHSVGFRGDRFHRPMALQGEMVPYNACVMSIDPAGKGKDELAYAVGKEKNGFLYVVEGLGLRGGYTKENLTILANRAKHHGVNYIVVEPNFGGGMFNELLKPILRNIHPCTVADAEWSSAQKERRIIETLEPVMNQHRLVFDRKVILADPKAHEGESQEQALSRQLFHQMTRITQDRGCLKHDDRLDALAILVAYFTKHMAQDAVRKTHERHEKEFHARIREMRVGGRIRNKDARPRGPASFLSKLFGR